MQSRSLNDIKDTDNYILAAAPVISQQVSSAKPAQDDRKNTL